MTWDNFHILTNALKERMGGVEICVDIALMERKTVMLLRKAVMEEAGPRTLKIIYVFQRHETKSGLMDFPFR